VKGKFKVVVTTLVVIIAVLLWLAGRDGSPPPGAPPADPPRLPDKLPVAPPIEVIIPPDKQPVGAGQVSALLVPETMAALRALPRDLVRSAAEDDEILMEPFGER